MTNRGGGEDRPHEEGCACCGGPASEPGPPIEFPGNFRLYVIHADDPGKAPTGKEHVHAATNDTQIARDLLNGLTARGIEASGWDNVQRTWFVTPEIMEAIRRIEPDPTSRH